MTMPVTMSDADIKKAEQQSVQVPPDAVNNQLLYLPAISRGDWLPARGTQSREKALDAWYYHDTQWMARGAIAGIAKKIASLPFEISGRDDVTQFRDILLNANFGQGWAHFIQQVVTSYLRFDSGATIEIIAGGDERRAPVGAVMGIAILDPLRVLPTGDPLYPVIYYDRNGGRHLLHRARVMRLIDTPDTNEYIHFGDCALARAIGIAQMQLTQMRYVTTFLDDKPVPGYIIYNNLSKPQVLRAWQEYHQQQNQDAPPEWGMTLPLFSMDSNNPVSVQTVTHQQAPEKFDYKVYTELNVNALALALGVDVQEFWQLSSGNIGSAAQSEILNQKSRGKTVGLLVIELERLINQILPDDVTFEFKYKDEEEALSEAQKAQVWANVYTTIKDALSPEEQRIFLANNIEAVREAMTDDVVARTDDVQDAGAIAQEEVADDTETQAQDTPTTDAAKAVANKQGSIDNLQQEFVGRFNSVMTSIRDGELEDRRRAGIILRSMISLFGRRAYMLGLEDGGVPSEVTEGDEGRIKALIAQQSAYVSAFTLDLIRGAGISDAQANQRPEMWFNKSIQPFYDAGRLSADANGVYEFGGPDGDENCPTCKTLKYGVQGEAHRHRLSTWTKASLVPKIDTKNYHCGGWHCQHRLIKTTLPAQGDLRRVPRA